MPNSLLVDETTDDQEQFATLPTDGESLEQDLQQATSQQQAPDPYAGLPDKYRGKTVAEIAQMHQSAEQLIGRQGNELATLRELSDAALALKRREDLESSGGTVEDTPISADDILSDPQAVVSRVAEKTLKPVVDRLSRIEQRTIHEQFVGNHPTFQQDMQDPDFVEFVAKSRYRTNLALRARGNDYDAADELFTGWEEHRAATVKPTETTTTAEEKQDQGKQKSLAEATLVSGTSREEGGVQTGKVYSRLDLQRLQVEDPEKYYSEGFQKTIMKAYQEGRVR